MPGRRLRRDRFDSTRFQPGTSPRLGPRPQNREIPTRPTNAGAVSTSRNETLQGISAGYFSFSSGMVVQLETAQPATIVHSRVMVKLGGLLG